jgi:hypothetical protein
MLENQAVIAVLAAGNRDPERFPSPTVSILRAKTIDICRLVGARTFVLVRR